mmetsp:Transcript_41302/g.106875  ORF Transcript_41302/g.106875 Transcript_41302/m.106875 type:complete len:285 (-) Transcript_41302:1340-2194(-)
MDVLKSGRCEEEELSLFPFEFGIGSSKRASYAALLSAVFSLFGGWLPSTGLLRPSPPPLLGGELERYTFSISSVRLPISSKYENFVSFSKSFSEVFDMLLSFSFSKFRANCDCNPPSAHASFSVGMVGTWPLSRGLISLPRDIVDASFSPSLLALVERRCANSSASLASAAALSFESAKAALLFPLWPGRIGDLVGLFTPDRAPDRKAVWPPSVYAVNLPKSSSSLRRSLSLLSPALSLLLLDGAAPAKSLPTSLLSLLMYPSIPLASVLVVTAASSVSHALMW